LQAQCRSRQPLKWIGSGKRDIEAVPDGVKDVFGHAIDLAQAGGCIFQPIVDGVSG